METVSDCTLEDVWAFRSTFHYGNMIVLLVHTHVYM